MTRKSKRNAKRRGGGRSSARHRAGRSTATERQSVPERQSVAIDSSTPDAGEVDTSKRDVATRDTAGDSAAESLATVTRLVGEAAASSVEAGVTAALSDRPSQDASSVSSNASDTTQVPETVPVIDGEVTQRISRVLDVNTDVMAQLINEFNALKNAIDGRLLSVDDIPTGELESESRVGSSPESLLSPESADSAADYSAWLSGQSEALPPQEADRSGALVAEIAADITRVRERLSPAVGDSDSADQEFGEILTKLESLSERVERASNDRLRLLQENADLVDDNVGLREENQTLSDQSSDLASRVAHKTARTAVPEIDRSESLSWEERKELILTQMADDSFDAGSFIDTLASELPTPSETSRDQVSGDAEPAGAFGACCSVLAGPETFADPVEYVVQLHHEMERRGEEIRELRILLDEQSTQRSQSTHSSEGTAIGAAAIAELVDSDELVMEERERLKQLQVEWEEKFREGEIAASLERAKLARERREVATKQEQLDEQLQHARRAIQVAAANGGDSTSRRWRSKLGLE